MAQSNANPALSGPEAIEQVESWPVVMFIGLATLALGVIVLVWPSETLKVLAIVIGLQVLLFGVYRLISAFSSSTTNPGMTGFVGLIGVVIGIAILRNPTETVAVLATLLGIVWIVGGLIELIGSIADHERANRGLIAFSGALSIAAGVVIVSWPAPTVNVIAWVAGLYMALFGLVICYSAIKLRSLES